MDDHALSVFAVGDTLMTVLSIRQCVRLMATISACGATARELLAIATVSHTEARDWGLVQYLIRLVHCETLVVSDRHPV